MKNGFAGFLVWLLTVSVILVAAVWFFTRDDPDQAEYSRSLAGLWELQEVSIETSGRQFSIGREELLSAKETIGNFAVGWEKIVVQNLGLCLEIPEDEEKACIADNTKRNVQSASNCLKDAIFIIGLLPSFVAFDGSVFKIEEVDFRSGLVVITYDPPGILNMERLMLEKREDALVRRVGNYCSLRYLVGKSKSGG